MNKKTGQKLTSILKHNIALEKKDRETINQIYARLVSEEQDISFEEVIKYIGNFERKHKLGNFFVFNVFDFFFEISQHDNTNKIIFFDKYTGHEVGQLVGVYEKIYIEPDGIYVIDKDQNKYDLLTVAIFGDSYFFYDRYKSTLDIDDFGIIPF